MNYFANHQRWIGYLLFGGGLIFFLLLFFDSALWPILCLTPGLIFLYASMNFGRMAAPLVLPAALICTTGVMLLYQSLTNNLYSWMYMWLLYGVVGGIALRYVARRIDVPDLRPIGTLVMYASGSMFIFFGGMVEFIATVFFQKSGGFFFGGLLLLMGLYYILRPRPKSSAPPDGVTIAPPESGMMGKTFDHVIAAMRVRTDRLRRDLERYVNEWGKRPPPSPPPAAPPPPPLAD